MGFAPLPCCHACVHQQLTRIIKGISLIVPTGRQGSMISQTRANDEKTEQYLLFHFILPIISDLTWAILASTADSLLLDSTISRLWWTAGSLKIQTLTQGSNISFPFDHAFQYFWHIIGRACTSNSYQTWLDLHCCQLVRVLYFKAINY